MKQILVVMAFLVTIIECPAQIVINEPDLVINHEAYFGERVLLGAAHFTPDGNVITCAGTSVLIWDVETGQVISEIEHGYFFRAQTAWVLPDKQRVLSVGSVNESGAHYGIIYIERIDSGDELLEKYIDSNEMVLLSPDGNYFVTGIDDSIRIWSTAPGAEDPILSVSGSIWGTLAFISNRKAIIGTKIYDLKTGELTGGFPWLDPSLFYAESFSADMRIYSSGDGIFAFPSVKRLSSTYAGSRLLESNGIMLTKNNDNDVEIWDVGRFEMLGKIDIETDGWLFDYDYYMDSGKLLILTNVDEYPDAIAVWDASDAIALFEPVQELEVLQSDYSVEEVAVLPPGRWIESNPILAGADGGVLAAIPEIDGAGTRIVWKVNGQEIDIAKAAPFAPVLDMTPAGPDSVFLTVAAENFQARVYRLTGSFRPAAVTGWLQH